MESSVTDLLLEMLGAKADDVLMRASTAATMAITVR
jgi:hypothetical protein